MDMMKGFDYNIEQLSQEDPGSKGSRGRQNSGITFVVPEVCISGDLAVEDKA